MNISAVIITFNEERNIARCIDSLAGIADEIIVVDSCSTDRTKDICFEKKVRFIEHPFEGYIEQKNHAISYASFQFVLSLDADEALSDTLKNSVLAAKTSQLYDGYTMNRLTNYCGYWVRHYGWYPDKKLRLWNKTMGAWTGINPHDRFEMQEKSRIGHLEGDLFHYSYYTRADHLKQIAHFSTIAAKELYKRQRPFRYYNLIINPVAGFLKSYFILGGFLDGKTGLTICLLSAKAVFLKYLKLKKLYKGESR